jgi:hypothetical protein
MQQQAQHCLILFALIAMPLIEFYYNTYLAQEFRVYTMRCHAD